MRKYVKAACLTICMICALALLSGCSLFGPKSAEDVIEKYNKAQEKIENNNLGIRKNLLEYDEVMNEQREIIYAERRRVLDGESMRESIFTMIDATAERIVNANIVEGTKPDEWDMTSFNERFCH